jgi:LysR family transcriptional regulator for metE and metH
MLPRLGLHHLAVLVALRETGTTTTAAARLGLTQSAVSHRLREAERRLGVPLSRRAGGRIALTAEGERLRALGAQLLDQLAQLEQTLESEAAGGGRLVRLGQATYSRFHWLPPFIENLNREAPDLIVDLSGRATQRPFAALREGSVDVSTVYGRPPEGAASPFRWIRLGADPLVVAVAPDHPLAARDTLESGHFGDTRLYTYPLSVEPGYEWETLLGPPSAPYRRMTPLATPEAAIDLLRAGYGAAIFSRWAIAPELADGTLAARPIGPDGLSLDWWAVLRAEDPDDGPAARLADALVAWAARRARPLATLGFEGEG